MFRVFEESFLERFNESLGHPFVLEVSRGTVRERGPPWFHKVLRRSYERAQFHCTRSILREFATLTVWNSDFCRDRIRSAK